jgi:5-(carboxyamino)imidazole ribonucleotide synthase
MFLTILQRPKNRLLNHFEIAGHTSFPNGEALSQLLRQLKEDCEDLRIGILGGGELSMMMIQEALRDLQEGVSFVVLDRDRDNCSVARTFLDSSKVIVIDGDPRDFLAIKAFLNTNNPTILTSASESVAVGGLQIAEQMGINTVPSSRILSLLQNKISQFGFLKNQCQLEVLDFIVLDSPNDIAAIDQHQLTFPLILKLAISYSDSQSSIQVNNVEELKVAFESLKNNIDGVDYYQRCILQKCVEAKSVKNLSVVLTRDNDEEIFCYEPAQVFYQNQSLDRVECVTSPAEINEDQKVKLTEQATTIANQLRIVGMLTVKFVIDDEQNIWVDEVLARVHETGNHTLGGYDVSQFKLWLDRLRGQSIGYIQPQKLTNNVATINIYQAGGVTNKEDYVAAAQANCDDTNVQSKWYNKFDSRNTPLGHALIKANLKANFVTQFDAVKNSLDRFDSQSQR